MIDQLGRQTAPLGGEQQTIDRIGAAGLIGLDVGVEMQDVLAGVAVDPVGVGIRQEVREVGTDDDQRFRASPEQVENLRDGLRRGMANGQRDDGEGVEDALKEGQMHFQRVFLGVSGVAENDLRQIGDLSDRCLVEPNIAERRGECRGFGQR